MNKMAIVFLGYYLKVVIGSERYHLSLKLFHFQHRWFFLGVEFHRFRVLLNQIIVSRDWDVSREN
jgi:hypothetical protein